MKQVLVFLWGLCIFLTLASPAPAMPQAREVPTIPWELDRDGLRQWKSVKEECSTCNGTGEEECKGCKKGGVTVCAECDLKRETTCRDCAGKGLEYDPLVEMICPFCVGSALWQCPACNGRGQYKVNGGSKKGQRCGSCKSEGSIKCYACKGKRRIAVLKVGARGPGSASAAGLARVRETLLKTLADLEKFKPKGNESEDMKAFRLIIKKATKSLPAFKGLGKLIEASMKCLRSQSTYVGYDDWITRQFNLFALRSRLYVARQLILIEICDERLEFNAKVNDGK